MVFIYQNRHHLYISDYIWKMGFDFTCHPFQRIIFTQIYTIWQLCKVKPPKTVSLP